MRYCRKQPASHTSTMSRMMVLGLQLLVAAYALAGSTAEAAGGSSRGYKHSAYTGSAPSGKDRVDASRHDRYAPLVPAGKGLRYQTTLYFHDTFNSTSFAIVPGVPGTANFSTTTAPFGLVFCVNDPVTLSSSSSTEDVVGSLMGTFTCITFDGLSYHGTFTLAFDESDLFPFAGTLSVDGILQGDPAVAPIPAAVVGGSGSFFMAQGTASIIPIDISTFSQLFQIDLDLYLPTISASSFDQISSL